MIRNTANYLTLILLLASQVSLAMPDDQEKLLELSADSAELNEQTHLGTYIGNVCLDQGTTHLRASSAITKGDAQNKLIVATAKGSTNKPAHYWTQTATNKPLLHAFADMIRFYPKRHLVELIGNAHINQQNNSFTASKISYDTLKQHIISQNKSNSRTVILLHTNQSS